MQDTQDTAKITANDSNAIKKKIARLSYSSPYSTMTQTQMTHMTRNNAITGDVGISSFYVEF